MPLVPFGLGKELFQRVVTKVRDRLAPSTSPAGPASPTSTQPGAGPLGGLPPQPPPGGASEILLRAHQATHGPRGRCLVRALYQAEDAHAPTWRYLACYEVKDLPNGKRLLYAACEKERWKTEAFDLRRFQDFQVTARPWPSGIPYAPKSFV